MSGNISLLKVACNMLLVVSNLKRYTLGIRNKNQKCHFGKMYPFSQWIHRTHMSRKQMKSKTAYGFFYIVHSDQNIVQHAGGAEFK